jgi:hypothetical protein
LGPDLLGLPALRAELHEDLDIGQQLSERSSDLLACVLAKHQFLKELIADRHTLVATAIRYRELDQSVHPGEAKRFSSAWPGSTELERYCHQIIRATEWELCEQPSRARSVLARLKAELEAAQKSDVFCLLR